MNSLRVSATRGRVLNHIRTLLIAPQMRCFLIGVVCVSLGIALLGLTLSTRIWSVDYELRSQGVHEVQGSAYYAALYDSLPLLSAYGDSPADPLASTGTLYEDGVELGPPHALHASIREQGLGRFSHWEEQLYFSSSDNSDPRVNGRRYVFSTHYAVHPQLLSAAVLVVLVSGFLLLLGERLRKRAFGPLFREIGSRLKSTQDDSLTISRSGLVLTVDTAGVGVPVLAGLAGTLLVGAVFWILAVSPGLALGQSSLPSFLQLAGAMAVVGGGAFSLLSNRSGSAPQVRRTGAIFALLGGGAALLCLGSLVGVWWRADNTASLIGGVIPYNDANGYWMGGLRLRYLDALDSWNMRRPINAAMHAVRLWFSDGNLWGSIGLQTIAALAAMAVGTVLLTARMGLIAGAAFFTLNWFYMAPFFPTTLSSVVGFTFSTLGFATLIAAARLRGPWLMALGACLIALGLNARAGAFFILPLLLVAAFLIFGPGSRTRFLATFAVLIAILVGFAVPKVYSLAWGVGANTAHSNFSYVLYGMTVGGKGWQQIYVDRPEIFRDGRDEFVTSAIIYAAAKEKLYADPKPLLKFVAGEIARFPGFASGLFTIGDSSFRGIGLVLITLGLLSTLIAWRDPLSIFLLLGFIGVWVSAPFIMQDGGARVFGSSFPFIAAMAANGIAFLRRVLHGLADAPGTVAHSAITDRLAPPVFHVLAVLGVASTLLPFVAAGTARAQPVPAYDCPSDTTPIVTEPGRTAVWLSVLSEDADGYDQRASFPIEDLQKSTAFRAIEIAPVIMEEAPPFALVAGYNLLSDKTDRQASFITVVPGRRPAPSTGTVVLCASSSHLPDAMSAWRGYLYRATAVWASPDGT